MAHCSITEDESLLVELHILGLTGLTNNTEAEVNIHLQHGAIQKKRLLPAGPSWCWLGPAPLADSGAALAVAAAAHARPSLPAASRICALMADAAGSFLAATTA